MRKVLGKKTNEFKIKTGDIFKDNKRDLIIIDRKYKADKNKRLWKYYKYKCNICEYEDWATEDSIRGLRTGCACCNSKTVVEGINDIPTTAPWMVKFFQNPNDAKQYTKSSNKKIFPICPDCGRIKKTLTIIGNIYKRHSINCSCSDKISYPEKLMFNILEQLDIDFITQLSKTTFKWCEDYKYDFYIPLSKTIIGTHGEQHYEKNRRKGARSLEEEQKNDKIKKELAINNGINEENYIPINCRKSEIEWIKNNILHEKKLQLYNLNTIDWNKAEEFALSNLVRKACEMKRDNPTISTIEIGEIMKLHQTTIIRYLKKGSKIWGWCVYNPRKEQLKSSNKNGKASGKPTEIFKDEKSLGKFKSVIELSRQSEEKFGVKLKWGSISAVCRGERNKLEGFTFKYIKEAI
ncbi:MAG TPA: hypothetical protein VIK86_00245 [Candidatus Paceibacterota bacterium]